LSITIHERSRGIKGILHKHTHAHSSWSGTVWVCIIIYFSRKLFILNFHSNSSRAIFLLFFLYSIYLILHKHTHAHSSGSGTVWFCIIIYFSRKLFSLYFYLYLRKSLSLTEQKWSDSEVFLSILRCSEVFWGILRFSEMFWGILRCSEVFWGVLRCSSSEVTWNNNIILNLSNNLFYFYFHLLFWRLLTFRFRKFSLLVFFWIREFSEKLFHFQIISLKFFYFQSLLGFGNFPFQENENTKT